MMSPRRMEVPSNWLEDELFAIKNLSLEEEYLKRFDSGVTGENPNSSAVSYVIGITNTPPTRYPDGLKVKRGYPGGMADIDLDLEQRYREKVINYTIDKYGRDFVAQITTFNTIKARTAVRDAARVLGHPAQMGNQISKLMPELISGVDTPLSACLELNPKYESGYHNAQGLRDLYHSDPEVKAIIDAAIGIEGLIKSSGKHAVISSTSLWPMILRRLSASVIE